MESWTHKNFRILCEGTQIGEMYRNWFKCVISGSCCEVTGNCALVGYYAASSRNFLTTFRDNLSVPSSGFKNPKPLTATPCVIIQTCAVLFKPD